MATVQTEAEARVAHLKLRLARIRAGNKVPAIDRASLEAWHRITIETRKVDRMIREAEARKRYGFGVICS